MCESKLVCLASWPQFIFLTEQLLNTNNAGMHTVWTLALFVCVVLSLRHNNNNINSNSSNKLDNRATSCILKKLMLTRL